MLRLSRKVTLELHRILRLPRKMNRMIDPPHLRSVIYNARSSKSHPPTAPNTAPATQNKFQQWSASHMKRHFHCAEQVKSPFNLTKYCACHEILRPRLHVKLAQVLPPIEKTIRRYPTIFRRYPNSACHEKSPSNFTKYCACHPKWLISTHVFSTHLFATHLFSTHLFSTHVFSTHLFATHLFSTHLFSTHLFSTHLFSTHLFSTHLFSTHLFSTHLFSTHLFSTHLFSTHLFSTHLFSTHLFSTHLFSTHLFSTNLFSTHLVSTHLFSTHLFSTHLFSTHLFSTHLFSTDLFSTHLFSTHLFSFLKLRNPEVSQLNFLWSWDTKGTYTYYINIDRYIHVRFVWQIATPMSSGSWVPDKVEKD